MLATVLLALSAPAAAGDLVAEGQGQADAAAQAAADAEASYEVDASGAMEIVEEAKAEARAHAQAQAEATYEAEQDLKAEARESFNDTESPEADEDAKAEATSTMSSANEVMLEHEDEANESTQAETGLVDAGADVSVWGHVTAFFEGAADAVVNVFHEAEANAPDEEDAKAEINQQLDTTHELEGELKGTVDTALETEIDGPDVDPRLEGEASASSVTEATAQGVSQAEANIDG